MENISNKVIVLMTLLKRVMLPPLTVLFGYGNSWRNKTAKLSEQRQIGDVRGGSGLRYALFVPFFKYFWHLFQARKMKIEYLWCKGYLIIINACLLSHKLPVSFYIINYHI